MYKLYEPKMVGTNSQKLNESNIQPVIDSGSNEFFTRVNIPAPTPANITQSISPKYAQTIVSPHNLSHIVFNNSNGLTFGMSNGSLVCSHVPMQNINVTYCEYGAYSSMVYYNK